MPYSIFDAGMYGYGPAGCGPVEDLQRAGIWFRDDRDAPLRYQLHDFMADINENDLKPWLPEREGILGGVSVRNGQLLRKVYGRGHNLQLRDDVKNKLETLEPKRHLYFPIQLYWPLEEAEEISFDANRLDEYRKHDDLFWTCYCQTYIDAIDVSNSMGVKLENYNNEGWRIVVNFAECGDDEEYDDDGFPVRRFEISLRSAAMQGLHFWRDRRAPEFHFMSDELMDFIGIDNFDRAEFSVHEAKIV